MKINENISLFDVLESINLNKKFLQDLETYKNPIDIPVYKNVFLTALCYIVFLTIFK